MRHLDELHGPASARGGQSFAKSDHVQPLGQEVVSFGAHGREVQPTHSVVTMGVPEELGHNHVAVVDVTTSLPQALMPHESIAHVWGQLERDTAEGNSTATQLNAHMPNGAIRAKAQLRLLYRFAGGDPSTLEQTANAQKGRPAIISFHRVEEAVQRFAAASPDEQRGYDSYTALSEAARAYARIGELTSIVRRRAVIDALATVTSAVPPLGTPVVEQRVFIDRQMQAIDGLATIIAQQAERDGDEVLLVLPEGFQEPDSADSDRKTMIYLPRALQEYLKSPQSVIDLDAMPHNYAPRPDMRSLPAEVSLFQHIVKKQ